MSESDKNQELVDKEQLVTKFNMDYIEHTTNPELGELYVRWYRIRFHHDFSMYIRDYGQLPFDSVKEAMEAKNRTQKEMEMVIESLLYSEMRCSIYRREA